MAIFEGPLGRLEPGDFDHFERYPLRALPEAERPTQTYVAAGIVWWPEYDRPYQGSDRRWYVRPTQGRNARGGHCFAFLPFGVIDLVQWWVWYNQRQQGACVGEGLARGQSLLNREKYDPFQLYFEAQRRDEWPGEDYDGTSVRAGFEVLRHVGAIKVRGEKRYPADPARGIERYRWALSAREVVEALGYGLSTTHLPFLNSWGRNGYPHITRFPVDEIDRHITQWGGEFGIPTDR